MLHALLTWSGPNQTAAKRAGTDSTNAWLTATNVWPTKVIQNRSGLTLNTFIQEPSVVPIAPAKAANLSPWNQRFILFIFCKKKKEEKYYKVNNWTKDFFQNFIRTDVEEFFLWSYLSREKLTLGREISLVKLREENIFFKET